MGGITIITGVSELLQNRLVDLQAQEGQSYCFAHDVPNVPKSVSPNKLISWVLRTWPHVLSTSLALQSPEAPRRTRRYFRH